MTRITPQNATVSQGENETPSETDFPLGANAIPDKLIKPWKLPPRHKYVLRHANIIDPVEGVVHKDKTICLADGLVQSISDSFTQPEDGQTVIDLQGRFVCPGLIDCHLHIGAVAGETNLANTPSTDPAVTLLRQPFLLRQILDRGFTTVRDAGGATLAVKEALADDVFPGPRVFICGQALSQTGGHGDRRGAHDLHTVSQLASCCGGLSAVADGVPECIRATREQFRRGADFIKILIGGGVASPTDRLENTQFTAAEVQAICEVARSYGSWVTAHAYTPAAIRHAVENGVTGIEHGNFIDAETARYMAERNVWLTPTLVTYDTLASRKYAGFLPPESQTKNTQVLAKGLESLQIAAEADVKMCFGSDLLGPLFAEQSREFGIRVKVLSSLKVLQAATINAAEMLRQEKVLGQVKEGYAADLLVLNGNPLEDVSILETPGKSVLAVIKDGRVFTSRWSKLPVDTETSQLLIE